MPTELVKIIFEIFLIPLLIFATKYLIGWLNVKAEDIKNSTTNEKLYSYVDLLQTIVVNCVYKTQQTYVDSLKETGDFDLDAQKKALKDTYDAVIKQLSFEASEFLDKQIPDLQGYIINMIEKEVYKNKKEVEN